MAINKFMLAALKAASYADIDVKKSYMVERMIETIASPVLPPLLYKTLDFGITVDGTEIPLRFFAPIKPKSNEIFLFFHGGGWVKGNIDSYTKVCADLANALGRRIISVDYRLAPEYRFPVGLEDCYKVTLEIIKHAAELKTRESGIILIGDSAGGNLAAAVSLLIRDRGAGKIKRQILLYPSTYNNHGADSPFASVREKGTDYLLTSKKICDYIELYASGQDDYNSPYFAPLICDNLENQPDTLIITAEHDPLRDEGEAYGEKLRLAGNRVEIHRMNDALHGFFSLPKRFSHVRKSYVLIENFLNSKSL